MAHHTAKYTVFLIVLILAVGILFYTVGFTSMAPNLSQLIPTSLSDDRAAAWDSRKAVSYFQVSKFNVTNGRLELRGNFDDHGETNTTRTETMIIGGLEQFITAKKAAIWQDSKLEKFTMPNLHYFNRDKRRVKNVNCRAIIKGSKNETLKAETLSDTEPKVPLSAEFYTNLTSNCSNFIHKRGYITDYLTEMEKNFSIAYSILMYKDIEQSERLFRAIYRPQHLYCIHVDSKTDDSIFKAMRNIADCFDNVFVLEKRYNVQWGTMSVLQPDIHCMDELWNKNSTWKYFINLTGQEFPLRTNFELVQILQAYDGANDVEATVKRANKNRWDGAGKAPHGIVPTKGSVHITASRGFVDYVLHDQRALDFLKWLNKTKVPDETFFASLNHNPILGVPGSYRGLPENDVNSDIKPFVTRFKNWGSEQYDWPCHGQRVRMICVFGTADLPLLASRRELFANKFYLDYKHYTLDCLEELHFNRTRDEYLGKMQFDVRWYSTLGFVHNKVE